MGKWDQYLVAEDTEQEDKWGQFLEQEDIYKVAEQETGVNSGLLQSLAYGETRLDPKATSETGAEGLFQFVGSTADHYGVDRKDPKSSAVGAGKLVNDLSKQFDHTDKIIGAWNAGPAVIKQAEQMAQQQDGDWTQFLNNPAMDSLVQKILKVQPNYAPDVESAKQKKIQEIVGLIDRTNKYYSENFGTFDQTEQLNGQTEQPDKENIALRLGKAWGRSVASLERGLGGALELTHIPGVKDLGDIISKDAESLAEFYKTENPDMVDKIAEGVSSGLQFLVPAVGVAKGTVVIGLLGQTANAAKIAAWLGIGTNAVLEAAVEAGNTYNTLQEKKGVDDKEATLKSIGSFGANLALITATNLVGGMFTPTQMKSKILRGARGLGAEMLGEGFQEGAQEGIGLLAEEGKIKKEDIPQLLEAAGMGALTAGIMSPIGSIYGRQRAKKDVTLQKDETTPDVVQKPTDIKPELETFFEQATPEQIIRRSKAFPEDTREEFFKLVPEDKIDAVNTLREKSVEAPLAEDQVETTDDTHTTDKVTEEKPTEVKRGSVIEEGAVINLGTKKKPDLAKITSIDEFGDLISLEKEDGTVVGETFDGIKKLGFKTEAKQETTTEDLVKEKLKKEEKLTKEEVDVKPTEEKAQEIAPETKPVEETGKLPTPEKEVKIPTEGQLRKTLKWGKDTNKSQQSELGKKARKAIRIAIESKNPELINQIRGKTVEEVAALAEAAEMAKGAVIDDKGVDIGATKTKRDKQQVLQEFDNGMLPHTTEAESQLRRMVNKLTREGETRKFEEVFTVVGEGENKTIMVEDLDTFDQLRGRKRTVGLDDARVQTMTTEDGQIYKLKSTGDKGAPITAKERTESMINILDFVRSDKPIVFNKKKFTGEDADSDAMVTQTKDAVVIDISEKVWDTADVLDSQFHEAIGHYGAERLMSGNKKIQSRMRKSFDKIRDSKYVRDIEDLYEKELVDVVKDKGDAESYLFYETVAHLAQDTRKKYIDDSGNWVRKPPSIIQRVWDTFIDLVKDISGKTTSMDRIKRDTVKLIDSIGKQAKKKRIEAVKTEEKQIGKLPEPQFETKHGIELVVKNQKEFTERAKKIAENVDGFVVQGIQSGVVGAQKPFIMARVDRGGINTNVALPLNFTKNEAEQKIQEKLAEFGVGETQVEYVKKQKSKPKPPKDKKTKIEQYRDDRVALENATPKNFKVRLFNFVARNMGGTGSAIRSMRSQLFSTVDKMKTNDPKDPNFKKVMELIDRFKENEGTKEKFDEFRRLVKSRSKFIRKIGDSAIDEKISQISKLRESFDEYNNLLRLKERGLVLHPYKQGTQELTNARGQYAKGLEKGTIKHTKKDDATFYEITDKGSKLINNIEKGDANTLLEDVNNVQNNINDLKGKLSQYSESVKKAKSDRGEKIKTGVKDIEKQIIDGGKKAKWFMKIPDKNLSGLKKANLFHDSFRYITNKLDNFKEGAFTKSLYEPLHKGRNEKIRMQKEMNEALKKSLDDKKFTSKEVLEVLSSDKTYDFDVKDRHGKQSTIKLKSGEKISLAMMAKNPNALKHLTQNGFVYNNERRYIPTFTDLANLQLTEREQDMVDVLFDYYDKQAEYINEISRKDVGYDIATEEFYHPLRVADWSLEGGVEAIKKPSDMNSLRNDVFGFVNPSSLKARTGSSKPIILEGAFDAMSRVTPAIANYYGMAIPYKQAIGVLKGIHETATEQNIKTEIDKLKTDVNQLVVPQGSYNPILSFLDSVNTVSALGLKMSTASLQPLSLFLVANNIGKYSGAKKSSVFKHLSQIFNDSYKVVSKQIEENSPMIWQRLQGFTNADIGDMLLGKKDARIEEKFLGKNFFRASNFKPSRIFGTLSEAFMMPIQAFDHVAIRSIWRLSEAEVMATGIEKSDPNFYKEVAKIAEKHVVDTQPTFDPFDRPAALRATGTKKSFIKKQAYKFMSQRMKNVQLFKQGMHEIGQGEVGTGLFRITNVVVSQYMALAAIKGLFKFFRGKMDEEEFKDLEIWANSLMSNMSDIIPIVGPAIGSMISGYKPSIIGQYEDWISAIQTALKDFADGEFGDGLKKIYRPMDITKGMQEPLDILDNMTEWDKPDWLGD